MMDLLQLLFIVLGIVILCVFLFFVLLIQMLKLRRHLRENLLNFTHFIKNYEDTHPVSEPAFDITDIISKSYHPAKKLKAIITLNLSLVFLLLLSLVFRAPMYIEKLLFILFFVMILSLPLYYLFLKKHRKIFLLNTQLRENNIKLDREKNKLISQFDWEIATLSRKITFNTLQAFELLNCVMLCVLFTQMIIRG
ncbi:MAG: hypothetical protein ABF682_11585 [Liquorilactobacillus sp.]|uniref:hypothetical protein n=1 Tax=Liquorilactobacillus sp. TaxID=2767923 RepID=UPI0039EA48AC